MSGLESILGNALGGDMLAKIAGQLNTDEAGAQKAVGAALPALLGRLKANADDPSKAEALAAAVNKDHDGSLLDGLGDKLGGLFGGDGNGSKIVGKVFGDDTDAVQDQVAAEAGIDKGQAAGLLGALAPMVMGALGKSGQETGGVQANGLSGMLGGLMGGGGGGGLGGMLGGLLGGGGAAGGIGSMLSGGGGAAGGMVGKVTGMLDQNKDGSVIDDISRMAGGGAGGSGKAGILGKLLGMFGKK
jgi:hypothetical protein